MTDRVDINRLLNEMRSLKAQSQAFGGVRPVGRELEGVAAPGKANGPAFGDLFSQAINKVNEVQKSSSNLAQAYMQGQPGIDVTDVMIASQKSSVAFQATTQVRNKLVEAYKDIMNMPL